MKTKYAYSIAITCILASCSNVSITWKKSEVSQTPKFEIPSNSCLNQVYEEGMIPAQPRFSPAPFWIDVKKIDPIPNLDWRTKKIENGLEIKVTPIEKGDQKEEKEEKYHGDPSNDREKLKYVVK